jgi:NADH-quinone oxidoreductase subunit J
MKTLSLLGLGGLLFPTAAFAQTQTLPSSVPASEPTVLTAVPAATLPAASGSLWVDIAFYVLAAITLLMALSVVVRRNPLHGALSMVVSFFTLAGVYVLLFAHLLAALQVLVYAGAIMVLFSFVVMLLNLQERELGSPKNPLSKGILAAIFTFFLVGVVLSMKEGLNMLLLPNGTIGAGTLLPPSPLGTLASQPIAGALPVDYGTVESVGKTLFTQYALSFELLSVLLLVAIVGAVAIAKRRV